MNNEINNETIDVPTPAPDGMAYVDSLDSAGRVIRKYYETNPARESDGIPSGSRDYRSPAFDDFKNISPPDLSVSTLSPVALLDKFYETELPKFQRYAQRLDALQEEVSYLKNNAEVSVLNSVARDMALLQGRGFKRIETGFSGVSHILAQLKNDGLAVLDVQPIPNTSLVKIIHRDRDYSGERIKEELVAQYTVAFSGKLQKAESELEMATKEAKMFKKSFLSREAELKSPSYIQTFLALVK